MIDEESCNAPQNAGPALLMFAIYVVSVVAMFVYLAWRAQ